MMKYKVIGLMSGTSLDGLDLAYCLIWLESDKWYFNIERTKSVDYEPEMKAKLKNLIFLSAIDLLELNSEYGIWLGKQVKKFILEGNLEVDFVASHWYTTHHRPDKKFTYQIGSGQHLANECGKKVIGDFRSNDIALGGQGAPLEPIGDGIFFPQYEFCLNLGGISNISFEKNRERIAYDIGLANMVLNYLTARIDLNYDENGQLAREGSTNQELLKKLDGLAYYKYPFPKSTGYEWFVEKVVPIIETTNDNIPNLLNTCIHHICRQVALQIKLNIIKDKNTVLVTGGGAFNSYMMEVLQDELLSFASVEIPSKKLIAFKEPLVFALMAVLKIENRPDVLCSVTGASKDSSNGVVYDPS